MMEKKKMENDNWKEEYDELDYADNNKCIDKVVCGNKILKKFVHDHSLNISNEVFGYQLWDSVYVLNIKKTCSITNIEINCYIKRQCVVCDIDSEKVLNILQW